MSTSSIGEPEVVAVHYEIVTYRVGEWTVGWARGDPERRDEGELMEVLLARQRPDGTSEQIEGRWVQAGALAGPPSIRNATVARQVELAEALYQRHSARPSWSSYVADVWWTRMTPVETMAARMTRSRRGARPLLLWARGEDGIDRAVPTDHGWRRRPVEVLPRYDGAVSFD